MELHPLYQNSADPVLSAAAVTGGNFTIPALSAVVFVKPAEGTQGEFVCNPFAGR